ncbi:MAG: MATE family efflux transporter [Pseudomonadota bacterium]
MVISQGAFAVMIFCDRWFLSFIDATHVASAMGGGVASFFCISLFLGVITYANAIVAQYFGAGELSKCPTVVTQGLIIATACIPVLVFIGLFGDDVFPLLGHEPAQVELESLYFQILLAGSYFQLLKSLLASYFAGIGRTRVIMFADVLSVALNIPLSWILIFGHFGLPELGIAGAGIGTIVATLFGLSIYLVFYLAPAHRKRFKVARSLHFESGILRRYLRLGIPAGVESFLNMGTFNVFLLLFQSYGVVQGAAMAIVFNWDMLCFVPMVGLSIAVMSLIGRFVGMRDMARTNQVITSGFILALGYSGVLAILFFIFRIELIDVFRTPDGQFDSIRVLASGMMIGLCTYMMADGVIQVAGGTLRGAGDTRWVMITSTTLHALMLVAQYFVIIVYDLDPLVSWWIFVVMILALAGAYLGRLLGNRWRTEERLASIMKE